MFARRARGAANDPGWTRPLLCTTSLDVRCGENPTWRSHHGYSSPHGGSSRPTPTRRGPAQRRIGSPSRPRKAARVALPLAEPPPKAAEWPIDILPPASALVRKLLPPDSRLPPAVLAAMVLPPVPPANATLTPWAYSLPPESLDDVSARQRGRGDADLLSSPTLVALARDALVLHEGRPLPASERADERGDRPTCREASYAKLRRIRPELSEALRGEAAARLAALLPPSLRARALPASLDELAVIDRAGEQIKGRAKRLGPARRGHRRQGPGGPPAAHGPGRGQGRRARRRGQ